MRIVNELPPNIDKICEVFPDVRTQSGVLFCYGDAIYNPSGGYVPIQLIKHEEVHFAQQSAMRCGPDEWWANYLTDTQFRFQQELAAHQVEYREFRNWTKNREMRRTYLHNIAKRLSGPLYGSIVSLAAAEAAIKA